MPLMVQSSSFVFQVSQEYSTYHIVVACSPAESNFPVNMAIFSPASFLSLLLECCNVRARASFSAQDCASLARSSAHFKGGAPCMERNLLCVSRLCFGNGPLGEDVAELEGVNLSAKRLNKSDIETQLYFIRNDNRLHLWHSREPFYHL